ncbi:FEKKY domain-containing protein [Flavobacterium selenitireducens]|uniref:FEKKY domain-containing protein n=1 Tax=Flavobacterium selenitireducens TaxID=2722704 RepID=UPI00168BEC22|nr:hypothetical protein [Flavobacterium selenitireducens]MBD3581562.1 hypothetical protein [Flavobacterium selenitireducens]
MNSRLYSFTIIMVLSFGKLFSQTTNEDYFKGSGAEKIFFAQTENEAQDLAKSDIQNNKRLLLLIGSIAPVRYSTDSITENKFNFKYYDFGCVAPEGKIIEAYNFEILKSIDLQSKRWRKEIRKDVIGLKLFKKKF